MPAGQPLLHSCNEFSLIQPLDLLVMLCMACRHRRSPGDLGEHGCLGCGCRYSAFVFVLGPEKPAVGFCGLFTGHRPPCGAAAAGRLPSGLLAV